MLNLIHAYNEQFRFPSKDLQILVEEAGLNCVARALNAAYLEFGARLHSEQRDPALLDAAMLKAVNGHVELRRIIRRELQIVNTAAPAGADAPCADVVSRQLVSRARELIRAHRPAAPQSGD